MVISSRTNGTNSSRCISHEIYKIQKNDDAKCNFLLPTPFYPLNRSKAKKKTAQRQKEAESTVVSSITTVMIDEI